MTPVVAVTLAVAVIGAVAGVLSLLIQFLRYRNSRAGDRQVSWEVDWEHPGISAWKDEGTLRNMGSTAAKTVGVNFRGSNFVSPSGQKFTSIDSGAEVKIAVPHRGENTGEPAVLVVSWIDHRSRIQFWETEV